MSARSASALARWWATATPEQYAARVAALREGQRRKIGRDGYCAWLAKARTTRWPGGGRLARAQAAVRECLECAPGDDEWLPALVLFVGMDSGCHQPAFLAQTVKAPIASVREWVHRLHAAGIWTPGSSKTRWDAEATDAATDNVVFSLYVGIMMDLVAVRWEDVP